MDKLISFFGGRNEAAIALDVTPSYITMLKKGKRKCSPALAMLIEHKTNGEIRKQELRPDLWQELLEDFDHHDNRLRHTDRRHLGERRTANGSN